MGDLYSADCITDIGVENDLAKIFYHPGGLRAQPTFYEVASCIAGPHFLGGNLLLSIVHFTNLNRTFVPGERGYVSVYNEVDDNRTTNHLISRDEPSATYIASAGAHYAALGPAAWDLLTLGVMDAEERTNVTSIVLPVPPCQGMEERVYTSAFKLVRDSSRVQCLCMHDH